jgi:hypothetical protein
MTWGTLLYSPVIVWYLLPGTGVVRRKSAQSEGDEKRKESSGRCT